MKAYALRKDLFYIVCMVLFAIVWFWAIEIIFPRYFLWNDNATFFLPLTLFNFETLRSEHVVPIINFFQFAGWNHLHAGQSGVLYPPAYVAAWIASVVLRSPLLTIDILSIGHLTAGMLGMYAWLRLLGAKRGFAMGGALLYLTLPFTMILSAAWVVVSYAHCFIPLCLCLLESNLQRSSGKKVMGYIFVKSLFVLQGYPQYIIYSSLFELVYIALRENIPNRWKAGASYILTNAMVIVLCLPVLLPMAEATQLSADRQAPFILSKILEYHLSLTDFLLNQIVPYQEYYYGDINTFLIGGSIFLPWIAYKALNSKQALPDIILKITIISVIALLMSTPLYAAIGWLPVINHFRWPSKVFIFFGFFYSTAFVLVLQWLHKQKRISGRWILVVGILALFSHAAVIPSVTNKVKPLVSLEAALSDYADPEYRMIGIGTSAQQKQYSSYRNFVSYNYPSMWKISAMTGYDPLVSDLHLNIRTGFTDATGIVNANDLPQLIGHLSRWSVRYLISDAPIAENILQQLPLRMVESGTSTIIYKNLHAYPIAAFQEHPMTPVDIEYKANRIRIHTQNSTGTLLVRVAPVQGYRAMTPDGTRGPAMLTQSGIILVAQEPQEFVDLVYRSASFEYGFIGTLIAALLMAIGAITAGTLSLLRKTARRRTRC